MRYATQAPSAGRFAALIAVTVLSGTIAAAQYHRFVTSDASRSRWASLAHDRNFHLLAGMRFALSAQHLDPAGWFEQLNDLSTWPALHPLAASVPLLVFGAHHNVGVLPSLAAWAATAVLAFLLVRRLAPSGWGATIGGMLAAAFVLASPAHRAYGLDVMLESLGACLTLLALYCYVRFRQDDALRWSRWVGLSLTLLFLEKYNYWLLVLAGLVVHELLLRGPGLLRRVPARRRKVPWRAWLRRQIRQPLNLVVVALAGLLVFAIAAGGFEWRIFGVEVTAGERPTNLWTFLLAAVLVRIAVEWKREGRHIWARMSRVQRRLARWHLVPALAWLLMPKRLAYFLFYISPANTYRPDRDFWGGAGRYATWYASDYHVSAWQALAACGLALVAVATLRRRRAGIGAPVSLAVLSIALSLSHTYQLSRFLHSWVAVVWVLAGVGTAVLVGGLDARASRWRTAAAAVVAAGLIAPMAPAWLQAGHSRADGHQPAPSTLDVSETYLAWLDPGEPAAVVGTLPLPYFPKWTALERFGYGHAPEVLRHWSEDEKANRDRFAAWLAETDAEAIVLVDIPRGSPLYFKTFDHYRQVGSLMRKQKRFAEVRSEHVESVDVHISLWRRKGKI